MMQARISPAPHAGSIVQRAKAACEATTRLPEITAVLTADKLCPIGCPTMPVVGGRPF